MSASNAATNYQDWWWNPNLSGMGLNIGQQQDTMFITWYNYDDSGRSTYLLLSGQVKNGVLSVPLYRTSLNPPDPNFNPQNVKTTPVGSASIVFTGDNSAVFVYNYENKKGSVDLQRFTFATVDITGTWSWLARSKFSGCADARSNGQDSGIGTVKIEKLQTNSYRFSFSTMESSGSCTAVFNLTHTGSVFSGTGVNSCPDGETGTYTVSNGRVMDSFIAFQASGKISQPGGPFDKCTDEAIMFGNR